MQQRSAVFLALMLMLLGASCRSERKAETVWSGLVMANNVPEPTPIPAELNQIEGTLKRLFGYNQFQVIGQSRKTLSSDEEDWQATSKYFSLHLDSKAAAKRNAYNLKLQLFQEKKLLLETEADLSKSSPLVIKGPQVGNGQLVLLVVVE